MAQNNIDTQVERSVLIEVTRVKVNKLKLILFTQSQWGPAGHLPRSWLWTGVGSTGELPVAAQALTAAHGVHEFSFKVSGIKCCSQIAAATASEAFHEVLAAAFISVR